MVVLIVGSTGARKTTYGKQLAHKIAAELYSIDEWMKALYWQDIPENPNNQWFIENSKQYTDRIRRCEDLILNSTIQRAKRNENTILDLGFSTSEHRKRFIDICLNQGIFVETHFLDIPENTRWERVQQRNTEKGPTFVMSVDRQMFDYVESIFEPPQPSEGAKVNVMNPGYGPAEELAKSK